MGYSQCRFSELSAIIDRNAVASIRKGRPRETGRGANVSTIWSTQPIQSCSSRFSRVSFAFRFPPFYFFYRAERWRALEKLSYTGILLAAVLGCVLADLVWFEAGRLRGKRVLRLLCALAPDPSRCIRNSKTTFAKKGVRALMIAKFIPGLDGICPPLAGIMGASHVDFIFYDAVGSALWAGAYITCGFLFATELDRWSDTHRFLQMCSSWRWAFRC